MDELLRKCSEAKEQNNMEEVIRITKEVLATAIKNKLDNAEEPPNCREMFDAVIHVATTSTACRYKNTVFSEAYSLLGKIHETGIFGTPNKKKAYQCYRTAAENSNPFGCFRLAHFYEFGIATKKSMSKAVHFYKLSANGGCGRGLHRYGLLLLRGNKFCKQDVKGGVFYLEQARKTASRAYPHALFDLAQCYEGIPALNQAIIPDHAYAWKVYMEGSNLGCPRCAVRIGHAYRYKELGVEQSREKAYSYYMEAQEVSPEARFELSKLNKGVNESQCTYWLKKAAEIGHPNALKLYAQKLEVGDGVPMNKVEADWWYKIAKSRGMDV